MTAEFDFSDKEFTRLLSEYRKDATGLGPVLDVLVNRDKALREKCGFVYSSPLVSMESLVFEPLAFVPVKPGSVKINLPCTTAVLTDRLKDKDIGFIVDSIERIGTINYKTGRIVLDGFVITVSYDYVDELDVQNIKDKTSSS